MFKIGILDKVLELKSKFRSFLMQRKQLKALANYSSVAPCVHKDYIVLMQKCLNDSFLGEKEADFLCHMVDTYHINYLDWSYKSPWLKNHMAGMRKMVIPQKQEAEQLIMFEDKSEKQGVMIEPLKVPQPAGQIPTHILPQKGHINPWTRAQR